MTTLHLRLLIIACLLGCGNLRAQQGDKTSAIPVVVDSLYREDQFYIGLSFNLINDNGGGFSQNGFSGGLHLGFIRDMPLNKQRNLAIGLGAGLSTNVYNTNLYIGPQMEGITQYQLFNDNLETGSNRFYTNLVEVPLQLRWRTSTPTRFTFWRVYAGFKFSYLFHFNSSSKVSLGNHSENDPTGLDRLRYAATLSIGNGSFNAFIDYNLNALIDAPLASGIASIELQPIKIGIKFYLL
ncbi:MAG: porin family protein [Nonlabens sp.]